MALASDSLENCVPDHLKREFFSEAHEWLPSECCPDHREEYINTRCAGRVWVKPPCCIERARYDLRTPGLFKLEYFGDRCIAMTCKAYFCGGQTNKQMSKGLSTVQNRFDQSNYQSVLNNRVSGMSENRGFAVQNNQIFT